MAFYAKWCQASSTYKALHDPWSHFIFSLWWVCLAEYLFVLRLYFSLVADGIVYHGYCKNCFSPAVDEEWGRGHGPSVLSYLWCFCRTWSWTGMYLNRVCVMMVSKLYCFRYCSWTWCCNLDIWTPMYVEVLVNLCNMWLVCWIMYDLGCMLGIIRDPSWYSMDYRVYMGTSMTVRSLRWLPLYLCSYKLVGSTIAGIRARFNIICHMCI